jgi:HSP20 family molecular chaperone IbpA
MASKATHLKRGIQNVYITVDQLFEAAFGPVPREYPRKSLMGWRPLSAEGPSAPPFPSENRGSLNPDSSAFPPPGVKIFETDAVIVVEVELPAIEQESLYLEISGDLLIIRGNRVPSAALDRSDTRKPAGRTVHRYVKLPVMARPGKVRARLEGNTVRVIIHKQNAIEK